MNAQLSLPELGLPLRRACVHCNGLLDDLAWEPEGICFACLGEPQEPRLLVPPALTALRFMKGALAR